MEILLRATAVDDDIVTIESNVGEVFARDLAKIELDVNEVFLSCVFKRPSPPLSEKIRRRLRESGERSPPKIRVYIYTTTPGRAQELPDFVRSRVTSGILPRPVIGRGRSLKSLARWLREEMEKEDKR